MKPDGFFLCNGIYYNFVAFAVASFDAISPDTWRFMNVHYSEHFLDDCSMNHDIYSFFDDKYCGWLLKSGVDIDNPHTNMRLKMLSSDDKITFIQVSSLGEVLFERKMNEDL
jgi:hypothetical protein